MKHLKKILTMFITIVILCSASVGVHGEGVVFKADGEWYMGYTANFSDYAYARLNEWLINTPYWAVDIFIPGLSTAHLKNDPRGNDKTIDFEITPSTGAKDTVIVADIPEEYRGVYNAFIAQGKKEIDATLEVSNIIRRKDHLILDYTVSGRFGVSYDRDALQYVYKYDVKLYAVTSDKQTGEIIRYDLICPLVFDGSHYYHPYIPGNHDNSDDYLPNVKSAKINLPKNFDPEKHEYAFCFIAYTPAIIFDYLRDIQYVYEGEIELFNYRKVDVPTEESPEPEPIPNPTPKYEYGDANRDGKISITDVSLMLKYVAGWDFIEIDTKLCDMNNNRRIDLHDVSTTLKIIAGWNV